MLKFLGTINGPFTRKVRMALEKKRIAYQFVVTATNSPDAAQTNPQARVSALVFPDASGIYDSWVIVDDADSLNEDRGLIPVDLTSRGNKQ